MPALGNNVLRKPRNTGGSDLALSGKLALGINVVLNALIFCFTFSKLNCNIFVMKKHLPELRSGLKC